MARTLVFILLASLLSTLAGSSPLATRSSPSSSGSILARHAMRVHERRNAAPGGFVKNGAADSAHMLNLRLALKQNNITGLQQQLLAVSTPGNAQYRQFLSKAEVEAMVAPSNESVAAVQAWLTKNNISSQTLSPAGDWIGINVTVAQANSLIAAEFTNYTHSTTGLNAVRTLNYSIPSTLTEHLNFIHPTVGFPLQATSHAPVMIAPMPAKRKNKNKTTGTGTGTATTSSVTGCDPAAIDPTCLQNLYGIPTTSATQSTNTLAVSGFINEFANEADLASFITEFRTDLSATNATFTAASVDGGKNTQTLKLAGVEAGLDIQYTVGIASGVPTTFVSVGSNNADGVGGFLDIIQALLAEDSPPNVLTTSYGFNEQDFTVSVADTMCNAYAQLGARGTSIFFSSGDGGVAGNEDTCDTFVPTFPSTCPYVTSVGSTTGIGPETAADFSSGGFSNFFGIPDYQADAVSTFLTANGNTNDGLFNSSGRAFPDLSAQGTNFQIFVEGKQTSVDGTSASSPLVAAMVSLLNDELIAAGQSPVGFMNPLIYSTADAFTDITAGDNPGCGTNGFTAVAGFDPVTGMGTPLYASLRTALGL